MGYLFVRYSVLDKLVNIKSRLGKWGYYGIEAATIACLLILRCWNPDFMVNFWGIIYTLLVVVIVCVDMSDIENTKVGKLLHNWESIVWECGSYQGCFLCLHESFSLLHIF